MTIWIVRFGTSAHRFYTEYHAQQFVRALHLNGTPNSIQTVETLQPAMSGRMEAHETLAAGRPCWLSPLRAIALVEAARELNERATDAPNWFDEYKASLPEWVPIGEIDWFVARMHVSDSDEQVVSEMTRVRPKQATDGQFQIMCDFALACHYHNRGLYRAVTTGKGL